MLKTLLIIIILFIIFFFTYKQTWKKIIIFYYISSFIKEIKTKKYETTIIFNSLEKDIFLFVIKNIIIFLIFINPNITEYKLVIEIELGFIEKNIILINKFLLQKDLENNNLSLLIIEKLNKIWEQYEEEIILNLKKKNFNILKIKLIWCEDEKQNWIKESLLITDYLKTKQNTIILIIHNLIKQIKLKIKQWL